MAILLHEIPHEVSTGGSIAGDGCEKGLPTGSRSHSTAKAVTCVQTQALRAILWTFPQVGDFAILLRAGFDRWSAAKLQLSTALGGMLGACFAICTQSPKGVGTGVGVVWLVAVSWGVQRGTPGGCGHPQSLFRAAASGLLLPMQRRR